MNTQQLLMIASRSDLAHLWMNFAKILLLVAFIYQNVLSDQLGLNLFAGEGYHVLYPDAEIDPAGTTVEPAEPEFVGSTTLGNPEFKVHFVPLSIGLNNRYDDVELEITDVWRISQTGQRLIQRTNPETEVRTRTYGWPGGRRRPLYSAALDLGQIVLDDLESAEYEVRFAVRFLRDGVVVHGEPRRTPSDRENVITGPADTGAMFLLTVLPADEPRFGEIVVVRRQTFEVPERLREMTNCSMTLPGGTVASCNQDRVGIGSPPAARYPNMSGSFDEDGARVPFTIDFIVQENHPPRAVRDPDDPTFVRLFSDDFIFDPEENQDYINLSQFVIDRDGKNNDGTSTTEARSMVVSGTTEFEVQRSAQTAWKLVPTVATPRFNQEFQLHADDEFSRDPITIEYARGRRRN